MPRKQARRAEKAPKPPCWEAPAMPAPELLEALRRGPLADPEGRGERLALLRREKVEKPVVFVGAGTCGLAAGAGRTLQALRGHFEAAGIDAEIVEVGCVGLCSAEPLVDVQLPGRARISFGPVQAGDAVRIVEEALAGRAAAGFVLGQHAAGENSAWEGVPLLAEHPFFAPQVRRVLEGCGLLAPSSLEEYVARGGYSAAARVLRSGNPREFLEEVEKSGLRGRGGGGFPTGRKWRKAAEAPGDEKYLICNAQEGDPGAFMNRALIEGDPHRVLEGMLLASFATGCSKALFYTKAEYGLATARMAEALRQAREWGLLGEDILGSGFSLEVGIELCAGAFVCGEETALIKSLEGSVALPRPRPPYPPEAGLFGKPTVINNVETLANAVGIARGGAGWFSSLGTSGSRGTKIFALTGKVNRPGLVEVPLDSTLGAIVFGAGGGTPAGRACKGVHLGGPSGGCLPLQHLDSKIAFEALEELGATLGSGGLVVLDEDVCVVDLAKHFLEFIQEESCGKCIPCREGVKRLLDVLRHITRNRGGEKGADALLRFQGMLQLDRLAKVIRDTSLCGLGRNAPNSVLSTLRWFRGEYEAHLFDRRCPAGTCRELVGAPCQTACPLGIEAWRAVAHLSLGQEEAAFAALRSANPLPSACARVCRRPCEKACRTGLLGRPPVAIRALMKRAVEAAGRRPLRSAVKPAGAEAKRVAVVGAGPAGLAAAHGLSLKGFRVVVFEREDRPGGRLLCAVPEFTLPRAQLSRELEELFNPNLEFVFGAALGRDFTVEDLRSRGFDAVFVATGAHRPKRLGLFGEELAQVHSGLDFLKAFNLRGESPASGRVGVVGSGQVALDAARVALRQPGVESVTLYCRRGREEILAAPEEIDAAEEEGVTLAEFQSPVALRQEDSRLEAVVFRANEPGEPDSRGRRKPVPVSGSERTDPLETLVVAVGEEPDCEGFGALRRAGDGALYANGESLVTSLPGVFAGGDVTGVKDGVPGAIAAGKKAAVMIGLHLSGGQMRSLPGALMPSGYVEPAADLEKHENAPRAAVQRTPAEQRRKSLAEAELTLTKEAAAAESCRCLRCDLEFTRPVRGGEGAGSTTKERRCSP